MFNKKKAWEIDRDEIILTSPALGPVKRILIHLVPGPYLSFASPLYWMAFGVFTLIPMAIMHHSMVGLDLCLMALPSVVLLTELAAKVTKSYRLRRGELWDNYAIKAIDSYAPHRLVDRFHRGLRRLESFKQTAQATEYRRLMFEAAFTYVEADKAYDRVQGYGPAAKKLRETRLRQVKEAFEAMCLIEASLDERLENLYDRKAYSELKSLTRV